MKDSKHPQSHTRQISKWAIFKSLFTTFIVFAIFGWVYEILLGLFVYHAGFINRGFFFGPWLPIYAAGGFIIVPPARRFHLNPIIVFLATLVLCTLLELSVSYIMEWTMGEWLWDYKGYFMNFQGRICLSASIRFGLMALAGVYLVQPVIDFYLKKTPRTISSAITIILLLLFLADCIARFFYGSNFTGAVGY